jgi:hypothetical protein
VADPSITPPPASGPPPPRTFRVAPNTNNPNIVALQVAPPAAVSGNDPIATLTKNLTRIAADHPAHFWQDATTQVLIVVLRALDETRWVADGRPLKLLLQQYLTGAYRQSGGWAADAVAGGQVNLHWRFVDGGEPFGARPPGSNQLGHYLTGLGHGINAESWDQDDLIGLDVGHELMPGDQNAIAAGKPFAPVFRAALSRMNRDPAGLVDMVQLDADLQPIIQQYVRQVLTGDLNPTTHPNGDPLHIDDPGRAGFSVQDLRLTAMAWHTARMIESRLFADVPALNAWLTGNLTTRTSDPESQAPAPVNPAGPWLNDTDYKTNPSGPPSQ